MKKIIHIGYHKTASTWLQKVLFPLVNNYYYIDRSVSQRLFTNQRGFDFNPKKVRNFFESLNYNTIISEEKLSGNLH